jgi:hypothetical protein
MSAFYDLASLVVVPSGYKAAKVYAQKPLTTDGQLAFTRASTATRVNASGLIESVATGVPRLDYLGSTCPKLLLEPQRSNVMTYSAAIDNADWTKRNATVTANAVNGPDGTLSADKLAEDSSTGQHDFYQYFAAAGGTTYTASFFAKAAERQYCTFVWSSAILPTGVQYFNLSNGTAVNTVSGNTIKVDNYGNGWYRFSITATATGGSTEAAYFVYGNSSNGTTYSYAGTTGSGTYFYGAQIEAGAYATSYMPTTTAAVTRLADQAAKTGISSLIGQSEGVWYWEGNLPQASENGANSSVGLINTARNVNSTTAISFQHVSGTSRIITALWVGNGTFIPVVEFYANGYTSGTYVKIAFAYKSGSSALYVNGTLVDSSSASFTSSTSMSEIYYHDNTVYYGYTGQQKLAQMLILKTRLTNAQLAELTSL